MSFVLRATSDLHLSERTAAWVFRALGELAADAEAAGGHTFLVGDIFDQAVSVHMPVWNRLRDVLWDWPGQVWVIPGNHDQYGPGWYDHCLRGLQGGSCRIYSRPGWTFLGRHVPYCDPDRFPEVFSAIDGQPHGDFNGVLPFVWTHHGFRGAYVNTMYRDRQGVSCAQVPSRHLVISGHYHMPQVLGRIVYCGSPYQVSFAEEGQRKGWLRWEDPYSDPWPVRIAYTDLGAPRHYTIRWDPSKGSPPMPEGALSTDRIRVVTDATRRQAVAAAQQLVDAGLEGVPLLAKPDAGSDRGVVKPGMDPIEAAYRYVTEVFGPDTTRPEPGAMAEFADEVNLWEG